MSSLEQYLHDAGEEHRYDPNTGMVTLPDCENVNVPKAFLDKLFENKDINLDSYNIADMCKRSVQDVYNNRKKSASSWRWSKSVKLEHQVKETINSVDRLLMLTLSKLAPFAPNFAGPSSIPGHFDTSTQLSHDALVNLRKVLSLQVDTQKKVYSNQAKIAAREAKRLLTTLPVEVQALNRDAILDDIKQLKKYHKDFKP
jgi:hypothetical protein